MILENSATPQIQQSFDKDFSDFRGAVRKDTVNLKLDIVKQLGQGCSLAEIVQSLSEKYHLSTRDIYYHYSTMDKWTQYFLTAQETKQAFLTNLIRLDYIYREFSFIYQHAHDDNARLGALKGMLFTIKEKAELTNINITKKGDNTTFTWKENSLEAEELHKRVDELIKFNREPQHIRIEVVDPDDINKQLAEYESLINQEKETIKNE